MKPTLYLFTVSLAAFALAGCSRSLFGTTAPFPSPTPLASPSALPATSAPAASATVATSTASATAVPPTVAAPTENPPTATPVEVPTATSLILPTTTPGSIQGGGVSGPYGVILVDSSDTLTIRSAAGAANPVVGSFPAQANNVMRTGTATSVDSDTWVEVQNPAGGSGWVNAAYLTEYVPAAAFCADARVNALLADFGNAIKTSSGQGLSALVSPAHGVTVRLWRNGNAVVFDQAHAQWIFTSTYEHDWGAAPGSGQESIGSFHEIVLPTWLDVLNSSLSLSCDTPQTGGASYGTSWPFLYANVNFYSLYKPGPAGNELSWRTLLVGVEYVNGQPYIFSVTQMNWEP